MLFATYVELCYCYVSGINEGSRGQHTGTSRDFEILNQVHTSKHLPDNSENDSSHQWWIGLVRIESMVWGREIRLRFNYQERYHGPGPLALLQS